MKDILGNTLYIGQKVATNRSGYTCDLAVAEVIGFTPKKVRLRFRDGDVTTKFSEQVAIVKGVA